MGPQIVASASTIEPAMLRNTEKWHKVAVDKVKRKLVDLEQKYALAKFFMCTDDVYGACQSEAQLGCSLRWLEALDKPPSKGQRELT